MSYPGHRSIPVLIERKRDNRDAPLAPTRGLVRRESGLHCCCPVPHGAFRCTTTGCSLTSYPGPDSVILTADWRVDVEQLLVCEENDLALLHRQALKQQLAAHQSFVFCCLVDNLRWYTLECCQVQVNFRNSPNGAVTDADLRCYLTGAFARPWLALLRANHLHFSDVSFISS